MSSGYPNSLDSLPTDTGNTTPCFDDHKNNHANANDAINKIEAELGTTPSGDYASVSERLDSAFDAAHASVGRAVCERLRKNESDVYLAMFGDSTMNDPTDPLYQLSEYLGSLFPSYTVLHYAWKADDTGIDSATTVQTGTGANTLHVYQACDGGAGAATWHDRIIALGLTAIFPVAPHLLLICLGHNDRGQADGVFEALYFKFAQQVMEAWPTSALAFVTQNPENPDGPPGALGNDHNRHMSIVASVARECGVGLIDSYEAFLDSIEASDWTWQNADGVHPATSGIALWLTDLERHFQFSDTASQPDARPLSIPNRIWLPAQVFTAYEGTPVLALQSGVNPAWSFDKDTSESILTICDYPPQWKYVNVWLLWTTQYYAGAPSVVWQFLYRVFGTAGVPQLNDDHDDTALTSTVLAGAAAPAVVGSAGWRARWTALGTNMTASTFSRRPLILGVRRVGGDGSDNYANDAFVLGIALERSA